MKASFKAGMHLFQATQVELLHLGMFSEPIITSTSVCFLGKYTDNASESGTPFKPYYSNGPAAVKGVFFSSMHLEIECLVHWLRGFPFL